MFFFIANCQRAVLCLICIFIFNGFSSEVSAQDACSGAVPIVIPSGGYGLGTFTSPQVNISTATVEPGETFQPTVLSAGQTQKSIWFKFSLPTTRNVSITLSQPSTAIAAGDVGFAVYKTNSCLPTGISKFTAITLFATSQNPCIDAGDYLVQVSSNNNANGLVYITLNVGDQTGGAYDHPDEAYQFGTLSSTEAAIEYEVNCQSLESATETCTALANYQQYTKSTWHTFTTPAYFDYVSIGIKPLVCGSTFPAGTGTFGVNLYSGDARVTPWTSLTQVGGCDSMKQESYFPAFHIYRCGELQPNTTYSVQIFYHKELEANVRLMMYAIGTAPTQAPQPILSQVPATNRLGILAETQPWQPITSMDYMGCNSMHSLHPCSNALPNEINAFGIKYNLSTFYTFELTEASTLDLAAYQRCGLPYLVRLFNQNMTNTCGALDTANLVAVFQRSKKVSCLPPGIYTLQISGSDSTEAPNHCSFPGNCMMSNLGQTVELSIGVTPTFASNQFSLASDGRYDKLNAPAGVMLPLQSNIVYNAVPDTIGCAKTVLPPEPDYNGYCYPTATTAIYREFLIGDGDGNGISDSGVVTLNYNGLHWLNGYQHYIGYVMYSGDANGLSVAQSADTYPERISGLSQISSCAAYPASCQPVRACVTSGNYTIVGLTDSVLIGVGEHASSIEFEQLRTRHYSGATAQDMNNILDSLAINGGSYFSSDVDYFSCTDNAVTINGFAPPSWGPGPATKAIYRQFYLEEPAIVNICNINGCNRAGFIALFSGRATDGLGGLTVQQVNGVSSTQYCISTPACSPLSAGWYTIVSYGGGPTYEFPFRDPNYRSGNVGVGNELQISVTVACPAPKFYRPGTASIDEATGQPHLLQWAPRAGSTPAYPKTDTTYTLPTENFNCSLQTPFPVNPSAGCGTDMNRIAYYVFRITQESYVAIHTQGFWGQVYSGNIRIDSLLFPNATPVQSCLIEDGYIELCRLQPGSYTLVIFAGDDRVSNGCGSVTPSIYIDGTGFSRFDHASRAYDFAVVPPDNSYHNGRVGDINPLNSSRAPSNDFIYCTTGSKLSDPTEGTCRVEYNSQISSGVNNDLYNSTNLPADIYTTSRRNLWYTFVADQPGTVSVKVDNKTLGRINFPYHFAIYSSDVDATLPFSTVVTGGLVDSTLSQGLTFIAHNRTGYYCYGTREISFYRDPCTSLEPQRYYILVDNPGTWPYQHEMRPNHQAEVSVKIQPAVATAPLFDHYYQAADLGNLTPGFINGPSDNFTCATADSHDPIALVETCSPKTLWYKFSTDVTGTVSYAKVVNGVSNNFQGIRLFRETITGDSTINGMVHIPSTTAYSEDGYYYQASCVSRGTYYIMFSGCNMVNESVYPVIKIEEDAGDYCNAPVVVDVTGTGTFSGSTRINCHTIGTDYGEFGTALTCPTGGLVANYKTTWFRVDIPGTQAMDLTTSLINGTNASSSSIKYRFMLGDCSAMQEQGCVNDGATTDTYRCLVPGSYFIQVMTPVRNSSSQAVTGQITLNISSVPATGSCAPVNNCINISSFLAQFNCNVDDSVTFVNYSTYGSAISYLWDFGYGGQTSTAVSPKFKYPELITDQTYTISLTVDNLNPTCGSRTSTQTITIPARPKADLGRDTALCAGGGLQLNAESWPGSTYLWKNGSTLSTFTATSVGMQQYHVAVTFNGCTNRDTINVFIMPWRAKNESYSICNDDSVSLNSSRAWGETYLWSNGQTTSRIFASQPGLYINNVTYGPCTIKDTFNVRPASGRFNNRDTVVCRPFTSFNLNATVPGGQSYSWDNGSGSSSRTISSPGQYWVNINFGNCSVQDTLNVVLAPPPATTSQAASMCPGQSITLPWGQVVTAAGTYTNTFQNSMGCDSATVAVTVTLSGTVQNETINAAICAGENYTLPSGIVVSVAGTYRDTLQNISGCDSLYREVNLLVNSVSVASEAITVCNNQLPFTWNGTSLAVAGVHQATILNSNGCDSVITLTLNVVDEVSGNTDISICSSLLPYRWNGIDYSSAGTYTASLVSAAGCDSTATLNLVVLNESSGAEVVSLCSNQLPFVWNGNSYNSAGNYTLVLVNSNGCDSTVTLALLVNPVATSETTVPICSSAFPYSWNGNQYNTAGDYSVTLVSSAGCDSIATLHLQQLPNTSGSENVSVCSSQLPYAWNGNQYNAGGTHSVNLLNNAGCDSTATLVLTVNPVTTSETTREICSSLLPYSWNGNSYSSAGTYQVTLTGSLGCDSVAVLHLIVKPVSTGTGSATICDTQLPYLWNGLSFNSTGIYQATLQSQSGCDSIVTLLLTVNAQTSAQVNHSMCSNDLPYAWNGNSYSSSGSYSVSFINSAGCDSTVTLNLTVRNTSSSITSISVCSSQLPYSWNGNNYSSAGNYSVNLTNATNCDSIATLELIVLPVSTSTTSISVCSEELPLVWNGNSYNSAGNYSANLTNSNGCDSIAQLNLTVVTAGSSLTNVSVCSNELPYVWNGNSYSTAGRFTVTVPATNGCDSTAVLQLSVRATSSSFSTQTVCSSSLPFNWNGMNLTAAGTYTATLLNAAGCDSVATLELVVTTTPPAPSVNSPVNYCEGQSTFPLEATISDPVYSLKWYNTASGGTGSPNAPTPSSQVAGTSLYYVEQVNGNCTGTRSAVEVIVHARPVLGADKNVSLCHGQVVNLTSQYNTTGLSAVWTFHNVPVPDPTSAGINGTYQLVASSMHGCYDTAMVNLNIHPPVVANAGQDVTIEYNVPHRLLGSGGGSYLWSPANLVSNPRVYNPQVRLTNDQQFYLQVTNDAGCSAVDTINIKVLKGPGIYVPTAFTPNGDGLNDVFRPTAVGISKLEYFRVFNRYGELVFETSEINKGWDGTHKGVKQNIGNYIWTLKGTDRYNREQVMNGYVVLVR